MGDNQSVWHWTEQWHTVHKWHTNPLPILPNSQWRPHTLSPTRPIISFDNLKWGSTTLSCNISQELPHNYFHACTYFWDRTPVNHLTGFTTWLRSRAPTSGIQPLSTFWQGLPRDYGHSHLLWGYGHCQPSDRIYNTIIGMDTYFWEPRSTFWRDLPHHYRHGYVSVGLSPCQPLCIYPSMRCT